MKNHQYAANPLLKALSGLFEMVTERNHRLRQANEELDERVKQRTTELEEANQLLQVLAIRDELTGLFNRRYAMMVLDRFWLMKNRKRTFSVLMLDADNFKPVNDNYGHDVGDKVLTEIAARLMDIVRTDDIVCRMGGDEFLVLCPDTDLDGARQLSSKISASSRPFYTSNNTLCWPGKLSTGVAERQSMNAVSALELLRMADQALYKSKGRQDR